MHLILNNAKEKDKYKDKGIKDKFSILYFTSNIMCYALKPVLIGYQLVSQGRRYMFNTERVQINVYLVRYLSRSMSYNGTETESPWHMWISPKLFLDQLNAWINRLFLFIIIKRTSSHDFLTRETEFESSSDKSSLILPIMALGRSVLGEYFFLAIFTQRNSWRERFWIFGRAPHLFLPGKIELIESFLILSNSF